MSYPLAVIDGIAGIGFDRGVQDGPDQWRAPFSDKGDNVSFECIRELLYTQSKYVPQDLMTAFQTRRGRAYAVEEGDTEKVDSGLVRVRRTLASVPQPRNEWQSYTHTFQYVFDGDIEEQTYTVNARYRYEYGLTAFSPIIAPRYAKLFNVIQFYGGANAAMSIGQEFPAEDSECARYKAGIYYRKTIYVKWPGPNL